MGEQEQSGAGQRVHQEQEAAESHHQPISKKQSFDNQDVPLFGLVEPVEVPEPETIVEVKQPEV